MDDLPFLFEKAPRFYDAHELSWEASLIALFQLQLPTLMALHCTLAI